MQKKLDPFYVVTGNTFQLRSRLKSLGLLWHPERKVWYTTSSHTASMARYDLRMKKDVRVVDLNSDVRKEANG